MHTNRLRLLACSLLAALVSCGGGSDTTSPAPGPLASVHITGTASVVVGGTRQLAAVGQDANATVVPGTAFTWSSNNNAVATVNSSGLVTGVAQGNVTITATATGTSIAGTQIVSVTTVPAAASVAATTSNTFDPDQVDIAAGGVVTWNFASTTHNVTWLSTAAGTPASTGDQTNASVQRTFTTPGTFAYHCTLHAGMNGVVVVH